MQTKLMKMEYFDLKAETRLEAYADTVVIEKEGNNSFIAAVRFGGYPESVKGMSDAIYGGGSVTVEIDGGPVILCSRMNWWGTARIFLWILSQGSFHSEIFIKRIRLMRLSVKKFLTAL